MLIKSAEQITHISDKKEINSENYIESIAYIGNLYSIMNKLKLFLDIKKLSLEPTFKGKYTCSKYNIISNEKENEMKIFVIKSVDILEDKKEKIEKALAEACDNIEVISNTINIILK